jgi:hypothetical protein
LWVPEQVDWRAIWRPRIVGFIEAELRSTPPRTPPAKVDDLPEI